MKTKHNSRGQNTENAQEQSEFEEKLLDAIQVAEEGHLERALAHLGRLKLNTETVRNARGVCLLRMGKFEEALQLFRQMVLAPGCTWMKRDLPVIYRTNFCTALLLGGHPSGCYNCLGEINEQHHPSVSRLREAMQQWEQQLSWWPWLLWKLGVEPGVPIELEFNPGDFFDKSDEPPTSPRTESSASRAA
jgi:pentatricopeptide repeat protein